MSFAGRSSDMRLRRARFACLYVDRAACTGIKYLVMVSRLQEVDLIIPDKVNDPVFLR
jgi:hypothetical protein